MLSNHQDAPPNEESLIQGKWVILAIVALALGSAAVSWVYYARLQERPLALWGSEAGTLILRATEGRAYRIAPAASREGTEPDDSPARIRFTIGGQLFTAIDERDVSRAPGFSHIRQSLIHDRSFAWEDGACDEAPQWNYALEFSEAGHTVWLAFAFNCPRAALANSDHTASIRPVAAAIEAFLREQFPADSTTAP